MGPEEGGGHGDGDAPDGHGNLGGDLQELQPDRPAGGGLEGGAAQRQAA